MRWPRPFVAALDVMNRRGKSVGVRLVKYTRKSPHFVHPKHLAQVPGHDWYLDDLRAADVVLDVGCANGAHTMKVATKVKRVVGIDYDVTQLRVASVSARKSGLTGIQFVAWDLTHPFPFPDSMFDAAIFLDVIEHLSHRGEVLREIRRVLKPDGRLMVSGPNRETTWRQRLRDAGLFAFQDPDHKVEYTESEFLSELRAGGFAPERPVEPVVYDTPWAGLIDVIGGVSLALYARLSRWKREAAIRAPRESTGFRVTARRLA